MSGTQLNRAPPRRRHPPGPDSGLIGWRNIAWMRDDLLGMFESLHARHGDEISFRAGPLRVYWFFHPRHVSEIFVKHADAFHKLRSLKHYFGRWMRTGLLLNEGDDWRGQRRKVRWALERVSPEAVSSAVETEIAPLANLRAATDLDIAERMDRLAFGLNVRALAGDDAESVLRPLHEAANTLHATGLREMVGMAMLPDWFPTASKSRLRHAMRVFDDLLLGLAGGRRAVDRARRDVMADLLVAHGRAGQAAGMSDRRARDEAVNLLMGGKETVGATLTFACYLLARHSWAQERLADEARAAIGDRAATLDDLPRLLYTRMVLQETMRLYPPVYSLTREVAQPVEIAGYRLSRGDIVMLPIHRLHRDERWHADANTFDPERFREELATRRVPYTFIPFGAGPRVCVGRELGMWQCMLALATLSARQSFRLAPGQGEPALATDIVLHPRDPLRLTLAPRIPTPCAASAASAVTM